MKNRYGDEYDFEQIGDNTYKIVGDLKYWRFGGQEHQEVIDFSNLGFADPSGGPFIAPGYKIDDRPVVRIFTDDVDVMFEVE